MSLFGTCACGQSASVTHACPLLSTTCRRCGSTDGGSTGHRCPGLATATTEPARNLDEILLSPRPQDVLMGWVSL